MLGSKRYNPDIAIRYDRKNLRLKTHNYRWSGSYFVTIRTKDFEPLFEIPELHTIVDETWKALPQRFSNVTLDEFIIMPDHVHFIIHIEGNVEKPSSLGDVVGAFKSLASVAWLRHVKTTGMERSGRVWQDNYFERIIRDARELEYTRRYIRDNPIRRKAKGDSAIKSFSKHE